MDIAALDRAADTLSQMPGEDPVKAAPVVPTIYRAGSLRLSLFSTIAQFGTPEDLTLDDLKIELYFPSDDETDLVLRSIWSSSSSADAGSASH